MMRLIALPAAVLAAGIGYGATVLGSEVAVTVNDRPLPGVEGFIAWSQETGSYLGAVRAKCVLLPAYDCHAVLYGESRAVEHRGGSSLDGLEVENGPALPIVSPYSGTFVAFPLR